MERDDILNDIINNTSGDVLYGLVLGFAIIKPIFIVVSFIIFAKLLMNISKENKRIQDKLDSILKELKEEELKKS